MLVRVYIEMTRRTGSNNTIQTPPKVVASQSLSERVNFRAKSPQLIRMLMLSSLSIQGLGRFGRRQSEGIESLHLVFCEKKPRRMIGNSGK